MGLTDLGEPPAPDAPVSLRSTEALPSRRPIEELGRKGAQTRRRLMNAARNLLTTTSAVSLTVTAVARAAKTSSATFYVYFDDVADIVLALAWEASEDLGAVTEALARWRDGLPTHEGATAFVEAFRAYYDRHRPIFAIRNMEADRGDQRFLEIRANVGGHVLTRLAALMRDGYNRTGRDPLSENDALARAAVIYSAIERLAASENIYSQRPRAVSVAEIVAAQIAMLVDLVGPSA